MDASCYGLTSAIGMCETAFRRNVSEPHVPNAFQNTFKQESHGAVHHCTIGPQLATPHKSRRRLLTESLQDDATYDENQICEETIPPYAHQVPGYVPKSLDVLCGTYELAKYAPSSGHNAHCPGMEFVCDERLKSSTVKYVHCLSAINCKTHHQMRVAYHPNTSFAVTFMHQMVPHHSESWF